jgi:hypothetical protein
MVRIHNPLIPDVPSPLQHENPFICIDKEPFSNSAKGVENFMSFIGLGRKSPKKIPLFEADAAY